MKLKCKHCIFDPLIVRSQQLNVIQQCSHKNEDSALIDFQTSCLQFVAAPLLFLTIPTLTKPPSIRALPGSAQLCPSEPERTALDPGAQTKNSLKGKKRGKTVSQEKDNGRSPPFGSPFHPRASTRDAIV